MQQFVRHIYIKTNLAHKQLRIFMPNISKIFQYFKKQKNLKEQRKTQRILWNEKRCAENTKISREIRERNTQHDKNRKKMQCYVNGKESKGLASGCGTLRWQTAKSWIDRAASVWT
jgi:hypothetical protein